MSNYEVGQTVGVKGKIKEIIENEDGLFLRLQVKTAGKAMVETFAEDQIVGNSGNNGDSNVGGFTDIDIDPVDDEF